MVLTNQSTLELVSAQQTLMQNKPIKPGLEKFFDAQRNLRHDRVRDDEEFDGYSCIFSTKHVSKEEMLRIYFGDKDIVEKAFHSLKGVINLQPIRHWLYNRVTAHVFICYLSYLLLSLLKYRLRKIDVSPVEALSQIDTMYKVYLRDAKKNFSLSKTVTLTKKQELILKTIDKQLLVNS